MDVSTIQRFCACVCALLLSTLACAASAPQTYGEMESQDFASAETDTYSLQGFSERFRATLQISSQEDVFRPGIISVHDRKSGAVLIRVKSDELVLDTNPATGEVKANIHELPYGEQSVLIYEDFNFDGIKDLALMDGQNSCYHGPSFQIFLGTADGFQHSDAFTELAQSNCGLFSVDAKRRQLGTMTKSGCCMHEMATYSIRNGEPFMESQTEIDQMGANGLISQTDSQNKNGKMVSTTRTLWPEEDMRVVLLTFRLAPSGKRVFLYQPVSSDAVYYAAVDEKDQVSLVYPENETDYFNYDSEQHILDFQRGDTLYRILADAKGVPTGMQVVMRGKTTELKLVPGSVQGTLGRAVAVLQATVR